MRAYRDAVLHGQLDGTAHHMRITAVKTTRDVGGRDVRHDLFVGAERPASIAFAHVAVDVDVHAHDSRPPDECVREGEYTAPPEEGPPWAQRPKRWRSSSRPKFKRRRRCSTSSVTPTGKR